MKVKENGAAGIQQNKMYILSQRKAAELPDHLASPTIKKIHKYHLASPTIKKIHNLRPKIIYIYIYRS